MNTTRCKCGCYVPDRCHACGRLIGADRAADILAGELPGPTREHIRRIEAERDTAMKKVNDLRMLNDALQKALAGQQAVINGRRTGLVEWLREELAVYRGDWCMAAVVLVWVAITVAIVAAAIGRWAA